MTLETERLALEKKLAYRANWLATVFTVLFGVAILFSREFQNGTIGPMGLIGVPAALWIPLWIPSLLIVGIAHEMCKPSR